MKKSRTATIALVSLLLIIALVMFLRISVPETPRESPVHSPAVTIPVAASAVVKAQEVQPVESQDPPPRTPNKRPSDLPPVLEPIIVGQTAWAMRAEEWKNVGRGSVGAAIQSEYWAIAGGDLEYLAGSMVLDGDARAALENLLREVPSSIRARYATPEALASFFLASIPALQSIAIGGSRDAEGTTGDSSVFILTREPGADRFRGASARYRQSGDGQWYRVVQPHEVRRWLRTVQLDKELSKSRAWNVSK